MKRKMMKKVVSLLLSVTMAAGMNGIQAGASNRSGTDGIQADALNRSGTDGVPADGSRIDGGSEEYAAEDVFTVTIDGETTAYQNAEDIAEVWQEVQGRTAEIHLLKDIDISNIEFKSADNHDDMLYTMYMESGNITFSMEEGFKLYNSTQNQVVIIKSGTFTLKSGEISSIYNASLTNRGIALTVAGGSVFIRQGATLSGSNGIVVYGNGNPTVRISGGTFQGKEHSIKCDGGLKIKDILANGYEIKDGDGDWIDNLDNLESLTQNALSDPLEDFTVIGRPVNFKPHPSDHTITYGSASPVLRVDTEISDRNQFDGTSEINYQWYQAAENKNPLNGIQITGAAGKEYTIPYPLRAGTHLYYCQASGSGTNGKHFAVDSEPGIINVWKKPITATIQGTLDKEYDGTASVPSGLSIHLEGVIATDQVEVTASSLSYDSAEEGRRKITVSGITILGGGDAENYILSNTSAEAEGTILPPGSLAIPVTGISLDQNELTLAPGGTAKLTAAVQPENASNQRVTWTSDDPDVASVDGSGVVTAVRTGKAVITVTTEVGHYSDSCTVTVKKENNSQGSDSGSNTGGSSGSQNVGWSSGSNGLGGVAQ